jgi:glycerophosphoryl diester phosphodiesterase
MAKIKDAVDGIGPNKALILQRPGLVKEAHDVGLSVTSWTFQAKRTGKFENVRKEMAYFLNDLKVDALFTNNPDEFPRD